MKAVEERKRMVRALIAEGILKSEEVIRSMLRVPREEFVREDMKSLAYIDSPLSIGYGQTISAPHMCAIMNEALRLKVGHKVLEVGTGSGYHACLIAEIVAPSDCDKSKWGHVYTIEIIPELVEFAKNNINRTGYGDRVTVLYGDGSKGYPDAAPYDRILVTASAPDIPKPLIDQLKVGGILTIPIGGPYFFQELWVVEKMSNGKVRKKSICPVRFVLLRGEYGWKWV